jgi:hypothetical protein
MVSAESKSGGTANEGGAQQVSNTTEQNYNAYPLDVAKLIGLANFNKWTDGQGNVGYVMKAPATNDC